MNVVPGIYEGLGIMKAWEMTKVKVIPHHAGRKVTVTYCWIKLF